MVRLRARASRALTTAGVSTPPGRAGEHEAGNALGVGERELHAGPAAHRLADDCGAANAGVVHYGAHVGGEVAGVLVLRSAF